MERTENEIIREQVRDAGGRLQIDEHGQPIMVERTFPHTRTRVSVEDYTQNEIDSILTQFKQRSGESELSWLVRMHDYGGIGINVDPQNISKFVTLSRDPVIQRYFKNCFRENAQDNMQNLVIILARAIMDKYPTEADIPANDKPWYALQDGIDRLKEEAMRGVVAVLNVDDDYLEFPKTASMRSRLVKTAPPAYKAIILTLTVVMTGNPVSQVITRMRELQDMGDWKETDRLASSQSSSQKHPGNSKSYNPEWKKDGNTTNQTDRVSRKEMFQTLLKAGMSRESIDGKQTGELWRLYKQKVLSAKKINAEKGIIKTNKAEDQGKTPTAPEKVSWEDFKNVYPWEELAAAVVTRVSDGWGRNAYEAATGKEDVDSDEEIP
ncbi:uncharacterized protein [Dendrobates tinctorius]|uniref:uncharacterized protein n=1 Tax=Dendrobates tinctorius TaxID=92724 RepID=UPI003CC98B26